MKLNAILVVAMAAMLSLAAFAQPKEAAEQKALYQHHCAMCHGPDASGNTPVGKSMHIMDLRSPEVQKQTDTQLTTEIENGKGKMPAFKSKLKPEQVKDLVSYLRELSKTGSTANK